MKCRLIGVLLWCVLATTAAATEESSAGATEDLQLAEVIARVAIQPPSTVTFTEQRHSAMLKEPLLLTGTLEYVAKGHLIKTIEEPFQETLTVEKQQVEITRDGRTERLSLKSNRMMRTLLNGIEAMLAGDTDHLQKNFVPVLSGSVADWNLQLQPRAKRIAEHLQQIEVHGDESTVQSIRIQFDADEWQLMELHSGLPETP